jgi:hypothetical protein
MGRVLMTRITRRTVLTIAGGLLLVALLIPPWVAYRDGTAGYAGTGARRSVAPNAGYRVPIGWHFIFLAPEYKGDSIAIDWSRLALEGLVIGAATALALYSLPGSRSRVMAERSTDTPT